MKTRFLLVHGAVLALIMSGCVGSSDQRHPAPQVSPAVTGRGDTIYFGRVYPLEGESAAPTYVYERRVDLRDGEVVSTHVTRDPSGAIQIAEAATHDASYALKDYTLYGNQLGESGGLSVQRDQVTFRLITTDGERSRVERVSDDVVVGPTLVGYIVRRLEALERGEVVPVRFALTNRLETLGFEIAKVASTAGQTRVSMSPASLLVGFVVDPLYFTFETASRKLVRLEGRVPPLLREGDSWREFDARVEYDFVAPTYR